MRLLSYIHKWLIALSIFLSVGSSSALGQLSTSYFKSPDQNISKPLTWWHWINGNVTKEGILKDLVDMKRVGIGGVQLIDVHMYLPPGPVRYGTENWFSHVAYAIHICDSLGMEFYIANSPGWSGAGGPWINIAQSEKKLVFSEMDVNGGQTFRGNLPQPFSYNGFYKNVKVLAVRAKGDETFIRSQVAGVGFNGKKIDSILLDCRYGFHVDYPITKKSDNPISVVFKNALPVNEVTMDIGMPKGQATVGGKIEGSIDGQHYTEMASFNFEYHEGKDGNFPISLNCPSPVKYVKLFLNGSKTERQQPLQVRKIIFRNLYQLDNWSKQTGMEKAPLLSRLVTDTMSSKALEGNDVLDLTKYYNTATNTLNWQAPAGTWTILRFGYTSTGQKNHPAVPEGSGYEADKFDPEVIRFQFKQSVGKIIKIAGSLTGKTFKGILIDSYEGGYQNWTDSMPEFFNEAKGYNIDTLLPVIAGRTIQSLRYSSAVLWDFRDVLKHLFATNFYQVMQQMAHENHLTLFAEGEGGPMSPAAVDEYTDVPMNEFWTGGGLAGREKSIKQTVSVAHILGKNIVATESFTSKPEDARWQHTPYLLKSRGDFAFAVGVNKFIFHTYTHQPYNVFPGFTMGRYGAHFGRTNTWWKYAGDWITYLTRSQYMLQQGHMAADVCYLFPSDVIYDFPKQMQKLPESYNYDVIYPERLSSLQVKNSTLTGVPGINYKLMILPECAYMEWKTLVQIERLVREGAVIAGPPPLAIPTVNEQQYAGEFKRMVNKLWGQSRKGQARTYGLGKVYWKMPVEEILKENNVSPDFSFTGKVSLGELRYIHRTTGENEDIYFISNQTQHNVSCTGSFRINNRLPELWDPVSGITMDAPVFDTSKQRTIVPLELPPSGSVFVVFRKRLPQKWVRNATVPYRPEELGIFPENSEKGYIVEGGKNIRFQYSDGKESTQKSSAADGKIMINGPWWVSFIDHMGAPEKISFPKLISWSESSDSSIRYYSGTAVYTNAFNLTKNTEKDKLFVLDLGQLYDIAEVYVNGNRCGIVWTKPYQIDISPYIKQGKNELKIFVVNRLANRLIGDEQIPTDLKYEENGAKFTQGRLLSLPAWLSDSTAKRTDRRYTFSTWEHYIKTDSLVPSGLLGPVQIRIYTRVNPDN